jgi:hypothetical protein
VGIALFGRKPRSPLPSDIVQMMERFGRHEIDIMNSHDDGYAVFQAAQQPLLASASSDPAGFIRALADTCVPVGGWAVYGADRTVINLVGSSPPGDDWLRILDASIEFLRAHYVPPIRVPPYAWNRFVDSGGTANTWIPLRPPPDRQATRITPLSDHEIRRLVKLWPTPDSNLVLLRRDGEHFVALIDSPQSDDDPTRCQREWKRGTDLYDLYLDIAWSCQMWDWADPEIALFFPAPKPLI